MNGRNQKLEIEEAILAGECALKSLQQAGQELNSARGWGIVDILGGGILSSYLKHECIGRARDLADKAARDMDLFLAQLDDVPMSDPPLIRFDGLTQAFDIFFDNIFTDVMVQSRLADMQNQLAACEADVRRALSRLYRLKETL